MIAKDYLNQYNDACRRILTRQEEINRLRSLAEKVTVALDGEPVVSSADEAMAKRIERIVDMQREVDLEIAALHGVKAQVVAVIDGVEDNLLRDVLERKYIVGQTLREIAGATDYSYDWTKHLHRKALAEAQKTTPHNTIISAIL